MNAEIKLFDSFAGYGGAHFALKKAKINHKAIGYSENDKFAIEIYGLNHRGVKNYDDITKIINENNLGIINEFDTKDHDKLIDFIKDNYYNEKKSANYREYAINNLSLLYANKQYMKIYSELLD